MTVTIKCKSIKHQKNNNKIKKIKTKKGGTLPISKESGSITNLRQSQHRSKNTPSMIANRETQQANLANIIKAKELKRSEDVHKNNLQKRSSVKFPLSRTALKNMVSPRVSQNITLFKQSTRKMHSRSYGRAGNRVLEEEPEPIQLRNNIPRNNRTRNYISSIKETSL
jgi:hypothetical protein